MAASPAEQARAISDAAGDHVAPLLARVEERLAALSASHAGEVGRHGAATMAAGGKRLRPLLVIVAGAPDATEAQAEDLVRSAAAVELLHAATLVHDDVLDAAPLRRGRPTVWSEGGRGAATATGDALFALAFAELVRTGSAAHVAALSVAGSALAAGELAQRADAWDATITRERYEHRCELKTARLFEAACRLGVLSTGGDAGRATALGAFGTRIGLAFQLLDDVLDVSGPAERTGKHRGTDLLDGTVTLPFILARQRDRGLAMVAPRAIRTADQAEAICDTIARTGALDEARAEALAIVQGAVDGLPEGLPDAQRRALELVAGSVVARYS